VSTYAYMRFLEASPERYDAGIARLTGGRIGRIYEEIAGRAAAKGEGRRVLDVGCGTGGVSLACAAKGARVIGIDANPGMLEVARRKAAASSANIEFIELGAMEIQDRFPEKSFDAAVSCLALSEMVPEERRYVLKTVWSRLEVGGILVMADEVLPRTRWARARNALVRWPTVALTYLLTHQTSRPIPDLAAEVGAAGFVDLEEQRLMHDSFAIVTARRGEGEA
jgi:ubiquinone/menaquinone biosynthesis C-methylase UbiE